MIYQVGVAQADITPSQDLIDGGYIWLWGYGARTNPCTSIGSRLSARALAIKDQLGNAIALVVVDVGAWGPGSTNRILPMINLDPTGRSFTGIRPEYVCINVSHTHGAPVMETIPTWQDYVNLAFPPIVSDIEHKVGEVINKAFADLRPATLTWRRGQTLIGQDRHFDPPLFVDRTLDVLVASDVIDTAPVDPGASRDAVRGDIIATAFFATCHATCNGAGDFINADFPNAARAKLEAAHGGTALFFQGFAGTCGPLPDRSDAEIGEQLADEVIAMLGKPGHVLSGPIDAWQDSVELPFIELDDSRLPGIQGWGNKQEPGLRALILRWTKWMATPRSSSSPRPAALHTPQQVIRIGVAPNEAYFVASAHEVAMDFGPRLRHLWPYPRVTTLGYSNAQLSYLPSKIVLQSPDVRDGFPIGRLDNYEGGASFLWYGHRGPLTDDVDDIFLDGFVFLLDTDWLDIGHAADVVAMTSLDGILFAATGNGVLWSRSAIASDIPWTNIGPAVDVVGLAALDGQLFCATTQQRLLTRPANGAGVVWKDTGPAEDVTAMAAWSGRLFATTSNGRMWVRDPAGAGIVWDYFGEAPDTPALTVARDRFIGTASDSTLWWRSTQPGADVPWRQYGSGNDIVALAAIDFTLHCATRSNRLMQRPM